MTTISTLDNSRASRADSNEISRSAYSRKSASLGQFIKTAAILGLALTGGAQARSVGNPVDHQDQRKLLTSLASGPFEYDSLCDSGVDEKISKGMTYENCMATENATVDKGKKTKNINVGKLCFAISGSMAAGFAGTGTLSLLKKGSEIGGIVSCVSFVSAALSMFPTVICGLSYGHYTEELEYTRDEAKECCKSFPKKAKVNEADTAKADNSTLDVNATAQPTPSINVLSNQTANATTEQLQVANASVIAMTNSSINTNTTGKHP